MDFKEYKCPVCEEQFKDGDDVVVCPECGAPHHRACYEQENHCAFDDRHAEGFNYKDYINNQNNDPESDYSVCPRCKSVNEKGVFYCSKCGFPLTEQNPQNNGQPNFNGRPNNNGQPNQTGIPFGFDASPFSSQNFDPMAGIKPDEDMGDGVTAGELSKFVQKSTLYYNRVFYSIRKMDKSRFNLGAFFFGGVYLLYRKMYKLGAIMSALQIILSVAELYITYFCFSSALSQILGGESVKSYTEMLNAILSLSIQDQMMMILVSLCSALGIVIRVIIGAFANRWYFRHCKNEILKIKSSGKDIHSESENKGGVNIAIAISILVVMLIINELPLFL